jgi:hypothetical protein
MSKVSTPHRSWCDQDACYTRHDGRAVHRSTEVAVFPSAGVLSVQLVDAGEGIEVLVALGTPIRTSSARLIPEDAAELAELLREHAQRAVGLERAAADSAAAV